MADYNAALNAQAIVRDYAVQFINDLSITTIDSIILQSSTLSDLTETTSELTRQTVVGISFFLTCEYFTISNFSGFSCIEM